VTLLVVLSVLAGWCVLSVPVAIIAARLIGARHVRHVSAPAAPVPSSHTHHAA